MINIPCGKCGSTNIGKNGTAKAGSLRDYSTLKKLDKNILKVPDNIWLINCDCSYKLIRNRNDLCNS